MEFHSNSVASTDNVDHALQQTSSWFFPILGAKIDVSSVFEIAWEHGYTFRFHPQTKIEPVEFLLNAPRTNDGIELAMLVPAVFCELEILSKSDAVGISEHTLPFFLFSLLSIRTGASVHAPVRSKYSFSTKITRGDAPFHLEKLEQLTPTFGLTGIVISIDDLVWATSSIGYFSNLPTKEKNRAMAALNAHNAAFRQTLPAMSILISWAGIESFFGIDSEITFRASLLLSKYLCSLPSDQFELFQKAKSSYRLRSRIAHGASLNNGEDAKNAIQVATWLRSCILNSIEQKALPVEKTLLFG